MKKVILTFIFTSIILLSYAQENEEAHTTYKEEVSTLEWVDGFKEAQRLSRKNDKPLLIFFTGSDWCGPCKNLHKYFFNTTDFAAIAKDELILYEADFPRRKDIVSPKKKIINTKLKQTYQIKGYPTVVLISAKGKVLARRSGFGFDHDTSYHFELIKKAIRDNQH